ncbi:MAG: hypothetical protein ACI8ZM_002628 [Crocinitomix sp.]|jgi:hypothetical protein
MKKSVKETLKLAVEQLFVRIHKDLFNQINAKKNTEFKITQSAYDAGNDAHVNLVTLCKEKIGYEPIATNQDIFYSIMCVYSDAREKERLKDKANLKR